MFYINILQCNINTQQQIYVFSPVFTFFQSDIIVFTWGIHRSPHNWIDSKVFKPFRFLGEESLQSNMYIPFGAGSRVCIGQHMAWLELRLAIAILLHDFAFSKNNLTPDLKFVVDWAHAVVHPDKDMVFTLNLN